MGIRAGQRRYWAVAATKSQSGRVAVANLSRQFFEHYQPEYREPPRRGVRRTSPLFPGYIFVRVTQEDWKPVAHTKDIRQIFMSGLFPARVANIEIERLRSLENGKGYIEPDFAEPPAFAVGESVEARTGIFKDKFGTYLGLADTDGGRRVRVLFEMLGGTIEHQISAFDLSRAAA